MDGIFIAQHKGELKREKKLFNIMIRVYRDPNLMIKLTGKELEYPKKAIEDVD